MTKEYLRLTWIAARESVINALTDYVKEHGNYVELADDIITYEAINEDERVSISFKSLEWFKESEVDEGCLLLKSEYYYYDSQETMPYVMCIEDYSMDEILFAMRHIKEG